MRLRNIRPHKQGGPIREPLFDISISKDKTMKIIFVFIAVSVGLAILWVVLSKKQDKREQATYVCTQCGERDCNCNRMDEIKSPDKENQ